MRFVMSAIVLLALVFILTSCNFSPEALSGKGRPPWTTEPSVQTSPVSISMPPCPLRVQAVSDVYIDINTLVEFLTLSSFDQRRLRVRLSPVEGILPTLSAIRFQSRPTSTVGTPVIRTLKCQDIGHLPSETLEYECTVPAVGDPYDDKTFFFESLELRVPGFGPSIVFREYAETGGATTCEDRGDRVLLPRDIEIPTLTPVR